MNNENNLNSTVYCINCGKLIIDESRFCDNCGTPVYQNNIMQIGAETTTHSITYDNNTELQSIKTNKNKRKKIIIPIIIILLALVIVAAIIFLIITNVICIKHDWIEATCTSPKQCFYCDKTQGDILEHKWMAATCTKPKTCKTCDKTKGSALGHSSGEWTITKEATLVERGVEDKLCKVCNKSLDSRTTNYKDAKVIGATFNFKDVEFIDWLNQNTSLNVGYTDLKLSGLSEVNTSYRIVDSDGSVGAIIFNHDKNGYIRAIMVYYDDWAKASALAIWIGENIDARFSSNAAVYRIAKNDSYTAANMTVMRIELSYDFEVTVLATSSFLD